MNDIEFNEYDLSLGLAFLIRLGCIAFGYESLKDRFLFWLCMCACVFSSTVLYSGHMCGQDSANRSERIIETHQIRGVRNIQTTNIHTQTRAHTHTHT